MKFLACSFPWLHKKFRLWTSPHHLVLHFPKIDYSWILCNIYYIQLLLLLLLLSRFSRVWLYNPRDGSPPGSPIPGILQARTLEWVAISFSNAWKWKVKVKSLSRSQLLATPWTAAYQAPPSMGFSRQDLASSNSSTWLYSSLPTIWP